MKKALLLLCVCFLTLFTACIGGQIMDGDGMVRSDAETSEEGDQNMRTDENTAADVTESTVAEEMPEVSRPVPTLVIEANGKIYYAGLEDNSSAEAFAEKLSAGPIEVEMSDYGNFEKVGPLPWSLPKNDEQITTKPGDVILYQGNQITIYYDQNTWNFTKLAEIGSAAREELLETFGDGAVTVKFWVEWSE